MSKWYGIMTVVVVSVVLSAAPVLAADIEVPADIGGITPNGSGTVADPYVYDFSAGNLELGADNVKMSATDDNTVLTNINVLSYTTGGEFDSTPPQYSAGVHIYTVGNLAVANVDCAGKVNNEDSGPITLSSSGGSVSVAGDVLAYAPNYGDKGGKTIIISADGAVDVDGEVNGSGKERPLTITGSSITVGTTSAQGVDNSSNGSNAGKLTMAATTGDITVAGDVKAYVTGNGSGGEIEITTPAAVNIGGGVSGYGGANPIAITGTVINIGQTTGGGVSNHNANGSGGAVTLSATTGGVSIAGDVRTYSRIYGSDKGGVITINAVGGIDIGGAVDGYGNAGSALTMTGSVINIGTTTEGIDNYAADAGAHGGYLALSATNGGVVVAGGLDLHGGQGNGSGGEADIAATGDVNIGGSIDASGGGVGVATGPTRVTIDGSSISVDGGIDTHSDANYKTSSSISLTATNGGVTIGGAINTYVDCTLSYGSRAAGDISISATGGDVQLGGAINANYAVEGRDGDLSITADGGTITLQGGLDVDLIRNVTLEAGVVVDIEGALENVSTNVSGEVTSFYSVTSDVTYQTDEAANAYLGGQAYPIHEGDGGGVGGGYSLRPWVPAGTVISIR